MAPGENEFDTFVLIVLYCIILLLAGRSSHTGFLISLLPCFKIVQDYFCPKTLELSIPRILLVRYS